MVAHTLPDLAEAEDAVAACLGMMDMEFNPCRCVVATRKGVRGLHLGLCSHAANPWH